MPSEIPKQYNERFSECAISITENSKELMSIVEELGGSEIELLDDKQKYSIIISRNKMSELEDSELRQFILDLDESDISISEWEEGFVKDIMDKNITSFTERQREVLNQMVNKYDHKIK